MKKKLLIVAAVCASLFVVMPTASVNAAEVEGDVQEQSVQKWTRKHRGRVPRAILLLHRVRMRL